MAQLMYGAGELVCFFIFFGTHLTFVAGITLAPVLASNFVYGEKNTTDDGTPLTVELRKETLAVPFIITGVLQTICEWTLGD